MIDFNDRVRLMNRFIKRTQDMLLEEGTFSPSLTLYKKGEPLEILETKDSFNNVILIQNTDNTSALSEDFRTKEGETVYPSHVIFKYTEKDTSSSDKNIIGVINFLCTKYKPDMVGFILPCIYFIGNDEISGTSLLHASFYTPYNRKGNATYIPYINRGELPEDKKKVTMGGDGVDAINYDITFFDSGWVPTKISKSLKPILRNPFYS